MVPCVAIVKGLCVDVGDLAFGLFALQLVLGPLKELVQVRQRDGVGP